MQTPVIILAAARSGTRMLRSLIASAGEHAAVPYDVNYIWRSGNERMTSDCLAPETATPKVARQIRKMLWSASPGTTGQPILEKTVGNILRIPFVYRVFPEARYVFLVRDGRDVVESAYRCWQAPPKTGYLLQKARSFPWWSARAYAWQYAKQTYGRRLGLRAHLASWGPRYEGIDNDVANRDLFEVCCRQWLACMESYQRDGHVIPADHRLEVRYEDIVADSPSAVSQLADFLKVEHPQRMLDFAASQIHQRAVGNYAHLTEMQQCTVRAQTGPMLERWGYAYSPPELVKKRAA